MLKKLQKNREIKKYLSILSRSKIYIFLAFAAVFVSTFVSTLMQPDIYRATITVLMSEATPSVASVGMAQMQRLLPFNIVANESLPIYKVVDIMKSRAVAKQVVGHFNLAQPDSVVKTAERLMEELEVATDKSNTLIFCSYTSTDPKLAADIVNYYPLAVRDYMNQHNISLARRKRVEIEKKINKARAELETSDDKYPREVQALSDTYRLLRQQYELSKIEEIKDPLYFEVLDPALVPEHPIGPKRKRNIILGAIAGLCLGIGIAFLREYLDDTIHDTDTIEKVVGLPVLVNPVSVKGTNGVSNPVTEEDRLLAKNFQLMLKSLTKHHKSQINYQILFTSVDNNHIKSLLMCRLAFALAEEGKSILIIDCDSGDKNILKALGEKDSKLNSIKLILADKLDSAGLKNLTSNSSLKYDYSFINMTSGVISSHMLELASQADFILTAVTLGQTSRSTLKKHKINLEKANPQIYALLSEKRG